MKYYDNPLSILYIGVENIAFFHSLMMNKTQ